MKIDWSTCNIEISIAYSDIKEQSDIDALDVFMNHFLTKQIKNLDGFIGDNDE